jgi:2',3'-cyclic-nucleotide 2'-phosphodiesterase (5'-nucleotidase family)
MTMKKKILISIITIAILLTGTMLCANATAEKKQVDVMFLHDTHSHLNEFATVEGGESQILGGFAKIKTL